MVAANVGVTLLPALAIKPPVARSDNIHLLSFTDSRPSRRIAMVWRRSSAMGDFLLKLAQVFRDLPADLFLLNSDRPPPAAGRARKPAASVPRA